jgi:hypothetical protein
VLVVVVVFGALAVIGTGSLAPLGELVGLREPQPAGAPDVLTDPADPADALAGEYAAHAAGTEAWPTLSGDWTLTLGRDSSLALGAPAAFVEPPGAQTSGYIYASRGDLFFTNLFTRASERGCSGPGRYRWALANGRLSLELVEDPCVLRATLLTAQPWTRDDG